MGLILNVWLVIDDHNERMIEFIWIFEQKEGIEWREIGIIHMYIDTDTYFFKVSVGPDLFWGQQIWPAKSKSQPHFCQRRIPIPNPIELQAVSAKKRFRENLTGVDDGI